MNVSRRSEEDISGSVSDVIRVGSIAIAIYEYVSSILRQPVASPLTHAPQTTVTFSPCLQNGGSGGLSFGEAK